MSVRTICHNNATGELVLGEVNHFINNYIMPKCPTLLRFYVGVNDVVFIQRKKKTQKNWNPNPGSS